MGNKYNKDELIALHQKLQELNYRYQYKKIDFYFPKTGEFSRDKYPKHMAWIAAGKEYNTRGLIGGNGSGKTLTASFEVSHHLTGQYPEDWEGRKFKKPVKCYIASINIKQLKAGIQQALFGSYTEPGTGLIPKENLTDEKGAIQVWAMAGGVIGSARIKHYTNGIFDGWSEVFMFTYEQGWESFQGYNADIQWLDEDPGYKPKIVSESLARTRGPAGQEGMYIFTGVPLAGKTPMYMTFFSNGRPVANANKEMGTYTEILNVWTDAPHLSEEWKRQQLEKLKISDPNSIVARFEGLPTAGAGRVYPFRDDQVIVPAPKITKEWRRCYGFDPGWQHAAVIWVAQDPNTLVKYIYAEYQEGLKVDAIHAAAIKARGDWIPGGMDPHGARHLNTSTGVNTLNYYTTLGLNIIPAKGEKTVIRNMILGMFEAGSLKIVDSCTGLIDDLHNLVYDENKPDKVAEKQMDHRPDAMEYALTVFELIACTPPDIISDLVAGKNKHDYTEYDNDSDTGY